ncbi:type II secretion system protein M [Halioglobus maricola]|uniref:Type II secretion system protein M n=1 Tax=Halioglobus maricola TaxID=2601894 RepID=A0A5P9NGT1_9GAMM|nr:type II secretion system protein M [Halioglobus maricola]QFU75023.1 type II secretion system protein M [Halioglobus maricola]
MKEWYESLTQREQLSLVLLGLALALYFVYALAVAPIASARDEMARQNEALAASLQRVDVMASQVLQLRESGAGQGNRRNLTTVINRSTAALGLQVTRLQPNSRGEVQVRMEAVAFDQLLSWLHQMEYREGLSVQEASITPGGGSGRVNATVRLAQAG